MYTMNDIFQVALESLPVPPSKFSFLQSHRLDFLYFAQEDFTIGEVVH